VISICLTCIIAFQPLASTGTENGMWFIGDEDPTRINFDAKTMGLEYSVCARMSKDAYIVVQQLGHRPVDLAIHQDAIWFIDFTTSISLYSIRQEERETSGTKIKLQSLLEAKSKPTDLVSMQDELIIGCADDALELFSYKESKWNQLQTLDASKAQLVNHGGVLKAFSQGDGGVQLWSYVDGVWNIGHYYETKGSLFDVLTKDDWLLIVSSEVSTASIAGIQEESLIDIASFTKPKGGWSVVESPEGLTVVGVERNGATSILDIGWPSGHMDSWIELKKEQQSSGLLTEQFQFLIPALLVLLIYVLMTRRGKRQQS